MEKAIEQQVKEMLENHRYQPMKCDAAMIFSTASKAVTFFGKRESFIVEDMGEDDYTVYHLCNGAIEYEVYTQIYSEIDDFIHGVTNENISVNHLMWIAL